jgi:ketosteroid isomerase-like protein
MDSRHVFRSSPLWRCALCLGLASGVAWAAPAPTGPVETVQAFHTDLEVGDGAAAAALLADDVTIFEQGFGQAGKQGYVQGQLPQDLAFAHDTRYKVVGRNLISLGDNAAVVLTQMLTTGTYQGEKVDAVGTETMLVRRLNGAWRISHIHWSAHPAEPAPGTAPAAGGGS